MSEEKSRNSPVDMPSSRQAHSARDIFVSYASEDVELAQSVVASLERHHFSCWIAPRDVIAGSLYADGIIRAITGSKVFVLLLSKHAIESNHVGKEVERASSKRRPIVTLRTDFAALTPALEYFLSESQWIDFDEGQADVVLARLVEAVAQHCGNERPVSHNDTRRAAERKTLAPKHRWIAVSALAGILTLATVYVIVKRLTGIAPDTQRRGAATNVLEEPAGRSLPAISAKSVAVLPFLDLSEKKDQEYFSDGLSEELIDMLTKVSDLRVPARTSSFFFKGKSEDIPTIAKRLLVAHVLEGSVRKSGNHMRITAQLVRADNGYHVWSETYDRNVEDIFKVQDEIAEAVVKALKISILGSESSPKTPSVSTDSYLMYLQGVALFQRNNGEAISASIVALQESIKTDSRYAPAWAMLARALDQDYRNGHGSFSQISASMHIAAERAVALDPKLPDGYLALSLANLTDWQWDDANSEIQRALTLDPEKAIAVKFASYVPLYRRQFDTALRYANAALKLDPLNYGTYRLFSDIYMASGNYMMAEESFRKSVALNSAQGAVHATFSIFLILKGEWSAALDEISQEPDELSRLLGRIECLDALARSPEADAEFIALRKRFADAEPSAIALAYSRRGEHNLAFEWLDRAYRQHDPELFSINISRGFQNIRQDPRFYVLLRRIKLIE